MTSQYTWEHKESIQAEETGQKELYEIQQG